MDRRLAWIAAVSAITFLGLAAAVSLGLTRSVDRATTIALQSVASYPVDVVANADTVVGQALTTSVIALGLSAVLWMRGRRADAIVPLLLVVTAVAEYAFKLALNHPSPGPEFTRAFGNPLGIAVAAPSAFPSGHVARVTFLAIVGSGLFPRGWVFISATLLVGLTFGARIYIGDHWLSDALGGLALGILIAIVGLWAGGSLRHAHLRIVASRDEASPR